MERWRESGFVALGRIDRSSVSPSLFLSISPSRSPVVPAVPPFPLPHRPDYPRLPGWGMIPRPMGGNPGAPGPRGKRGRDIRRGMSYPARPTGVEAGAVSHPRFRGVFMIRPRFSILTATGACLVLAGGAFAESAPAPVAARVPAPTALLAAGVSVLAELPDPGSYVSILRVVLILVMVLPWLAFCQWVDEDTQFVRAMRRGTWNPIVLAAGAVGLAVWLMVPWKSAGLFAAGFGLWFVITAGTCCVYVVMRNGYVDVGARVFTPRHIKAWLSGLGKKKEQKSHAIERVRLRDHDGRKVEPPTDPNLTDEYEVAQNLLFDALWRRATDAELLVGAKGMKLAFRIDGVVTPRTDLIDRDAAVKAMSFVKKISGLDVEEHRRPQEGSLSGVIAGLDGAMTEIEVRTSGTTQVERMGFKIVSAETRLRILDLGMSEKQQERFEEIAHQPSGLVIVSGPKESGVTTTLYACLRSHDAFMQNLLTLERDPLMDLENITQHVFDSGKHEASYARQLQTVLRREPDVVMVSDCPDRETAHLAAQAASKGRKIYMGIQARDSFDALKKLVSLAGDTENVAKSLRAVTCQRLCRKLCIACRQAYKPDPQLLRKANLPVDKIEHFYRPPPEGFVDEKGRVIVCSNCQGSGYFGRTGLFEILELDDSIRDLIKTGQPIRVIQAQARKKGMLYLQEVGLRKVIEGVTSMNEVLRVLRDEDAGAAVKAKKSE